MNKTKLLLSLLLLLPLTAMAQLDKKYSDYNDAQPVPFEITTIRGGQFASDTHWYRIQVATGKYWHTAEGSAQVYCAPQDNISDEYLWCFTGDNISGYRIFNKAKGAGLIAYASSSQTHEPIVMTSLGDTKDPRTFKVSANENGINFYYPGNTTVCINDLHGDGELTLWSSASAPTNLGCRMTLTLEQGDADIPSAEGLPFRPTKLLEDGTLASNTHWYTMTIRGNKNIANHKDELTCEDGKTIIEDQLWAFVGDAQNGFEIYNYESGTSSRVYTQRGSNESKVIMCNRSTTAGTYKWMVSENPNGGHNIYYPKNPTSCWNDFNGEGWIGIWRSQNSSKDFGSNIVFTEQNTNSVGQFVNVKDLILEQTHVSVFPGEKVVIPVRILPEDATNPSLWYNSLNPETCRVNEATGEIIAVAPGQTTIIVYTTDGSGLYAFCTVEVRDDSGLLPIDGKIYYVEKTDGGVDAFPESTITSMGERNGRLSIVTGDGTSFVYTSSQYRQVSETCPIEFGRITSFKFNNKFNPDIIQDAEGVIVNDSLIQLTVAGIGKWLTPSFKTEGDDKLQVYVDDRVQTSKVSRNSFKNEVTYTVSRPGCRIMRISRGGKYIMLPLGKDYTVHTNFLTDTGNVPTIYLTTDDGRSISSKTTYKTGTIRIDGGGVFADLEEMPMQIKGRGNSSWQGGSGKSPYHVKFAEKTNILGLGKGKHWNLIANANRMSMMTNAIGMKVARMVGTQAANDEIPIELYLNGEYRGSYNLTQKVGFGNNSLDVKDTLINACLLELDSYYDETIKFQTAGTFYTLPVNVKEPESFSNGYTQIVLNDIKERFINGFLRSLREGSGIETHVDVNSLATFLMTNELIGNQELMHPKSTFCFCRDILNTDSLFYFGPVWDLDWAYGYENTGTYFQVNAKFDYWTSVNHFECWRFMNDLRYNSGPAFEREYFRVWTDFLQNHLAELLDFCDEYQVYAQPSFNNNANKWYDSPDYASQMRMAKIWLTDRTNYIYDYLANELGYAEKYPDVVENPTPIEQITPDRGPASRSIDNSIYTLDGRKMDASSRLPRGIYIINGKKIAIQ